MTTARLRYTFWRFLRAMLPMYWLYCRGGFWRDRYFDISIGEYGADAEIEMRHRGCWR